MQILGHAKNQPRFFSKVNWRTFQGCLAAYTGGGINSATKVEIG
jgi:hypothetical protein